MFTGLLVLINYLLVISWFPAVLVLWSNWFEGKQLLCLRFLNSGDGQGQGANDAEASGFMSTLKRVGIQTVQETDAPKSAAERRRGGRKQIDVSKYRSIERFFYSYYVPFMEDHKNKILAAFLVLVVGAGIFASQLAPATEPARFLPNGNPLQRAIDLGDNFKKSDFVQAVYLTWGVEPIDRTGTDVNNPDDVGAMRYVTDFDPSGIAAQQHIWDTCIEARKGPKVRDGEVFCPFTGFTRYRRLKAEAAAANRTLSNAELVVPDDELDEFEPVEPSAFVDELRDFVRNGIPRTGQSASIELGSVSFPVSQQVTVRFKARDVEPLDEDDEPVDDGRGVDDLVALTIVCNTTIGNFIPESRARPVFDEWNEFMDKRNAAAPSGVGLDSMFHYTTTGLWRSMVTEAVLAESAVFGTVLSLILAFFVMLFSTLNILITLYAILSVIGIVVTFLGVIVLIGWELGIIESICISILVGLSIDYTLHIANAYNESNPHVSRFERMSMGILEVGISVFSAAITTCGAATLLLLTTVIFFFRFGLFIFLTIGLSFLFTFGMFVALTLSIGPKGDQGSLKAYFKKCTKRD